MTRHDTRSPRSRSHEERNTPKAGAITTAEPGRSVLASDRVSAAIAAARSGVVRTMAVAALLSLAPVAAHAQFDRSKAPKLARPARLVVPPMRTSLLPNGIHLKVVEQRELPLVQVVVTIDGGVQLDGDMPGMSTFMADLLDDGAGARDAAALQSEVAFLGANLSATASWDRYSVSLKVPLRSLDPALDLLADVIRRPTFSAAEVRRQRDLRIAGYLQTRDRPEAVAGLAFNMAVYPAGHPYHRSTSGDSVTTTTLDSSRVRAFYRSTVRPERTTFIVVGDISLPQAQAALAARFGDWRAEGAPSAPAPAVVAPTRRAATRVLLLDKPDAAQSVIQVGWTGVDRTSPDYAPLMVMNTILGGSFTSRLNMNLREAKGYSYGAGSGFTFRKVPGPFTASASVRTDVTDSSLVEIFRELRAIRDQRVSAEELVRAKNYLELQLPGDLEGTSQVAAQVSSLQTFGLTLATLPRFAAQVRLVTAADVQRVARKYLTPDQATVVVVGDLAKVRPAVDALRLGESETWEVRAVVR